MRASWRLSLTATFLSVVTKKLIKRRKDRRLKAEEYLNCAPFPSDTRGQVNLSQREQNLCLLKVWADNTFPLEAKPLSFLFAALRYNSLPAHAIFNLHRFSDLICILPHAPFQNTEGGRIWHRGGNESAENECWFSEYFQSENKKGERDRERTPSFQVLS